MITMITNGNTWKSGRRIEIIRNQRTYHAAHLMDVLENGQPTELVLDLEKFRSNRAARTWGAAKLEEAL